MINLHSGYNLTFSSRQNVARPNVSFGAQPAKKSTSYKDVEQAAKDAGLSAQTAQVIAANSLGNRDHVIKNLQAGKKPPERHG